MHRKGTPRTIHKITLIRVLTAVWVALAMGLSACASAGPGSTDTASVETGAGTKDSEDTTGETDDDTFNGLPIPTLPIVGATPDDSEPEPPPLHAVFSVVVRYDTSWAPYFGTEMLAFNESGLTSIVAQLTQLDAVLSAQSIPASFEFAYGPANALCQLHPDLMRTLVSHGHSIGINARTNGEVFRGFEALKACEITPKTLSGLASMADPPGPKTATATGLVNAVSIASIRNFDQVTGVVSPICKDLNLASDINQYGTGAFTAPWRSGWSDGNACIDKPSGQVVVIDQIPLSPAGNNQHIAPGQYNTAERALTQALGWTADHRYREAENLPTPGMFSWGITVRLADLVHPPHSSTEDESNGDDQLDKQTDTNRNVQELDATKENAEGATDHPRDGDGDPSSQTTSTTLVPELPTPALSEPPNRLHAESLEAMTTWLETFTNQVEAGYLRWVPPGWIGATLRAAEP